MREAEYMVGWPAGKILKEKGRSDPFSWPAQRPAQRPFLKNLAGRLASQPFIWLPQSFLGGILLVLVYYWMYFPYYGLYFPYYG